MKTVLVSQRLVGNTGYPEVREALDVQWGRFLNACGLLPVPVAARIPAHIYFEGLKPCGVLLTGGNDLGVFAPQDPLSLERDRVEKDLIEAAIQNQVPVLGICRGMQMLAHYFGCVLEKKSGHVTPAHEIRIEPHTLLSRVWAKTRLDANSFHNYCVTDIRGGLKASALHEDGTVEAFELPEKKVYACMWHPERVEPFAPNDIQFFKEVFLKS